ncbi:hypothetical protein I3843_06G072200 [Carya illinoinensis]|nr:hypothetical protein I3843_06G072200 [Carya illinoinensis]
MSSFSCCPPFDSSHTASCGAFKFQADLSSRGLFSSTVISSTPIIGACLVTKSGSHVQAHASLILLALINKVCGYISFLLLLENAMSTEKKLMCSFNLHANKNYQKICRKRD